jgi:hypothetical protein
MSRRLPHRAAAVAVAAGLAIAPLRARSDDSIPKACIDAAERGQALRASHALLAARESFIACSRDACPSMIRRDCAQWLAQVEGSLPSVVLAASDASDRDVTSVRVLVDGKTLVDRLDGTSVFVDPGKHVFRFEWTGHAPVEQELLVREAEKGRLLRATFTDSSAPRPVPVGVWILGGVAVAAGAAFGVLGATGKGDVDHLRSTCAPNCAQSDVDAAGAKIVAANVALGVGVVALGAAAVLFWTRPTEPMDATTTAIGVTPTVGGAMGELVLRF